MKYLVSKHLMAHEPGVIQNTITGQRFETSDETLRLLSYFRKPHSIGEILRLAKIRKNDSKGLRQFINRLIKDRILVSYPEQEIDRGASVMRATNQALVQSPKKTFLACNIGEFHAIRHNDIIFIGVPFDLGTTGFPGARFAPDRMRELSCDSFEYHADIFDGTTKGWLSLEHNSHILSNQRLNDIGNVILQIGEGFEQFYNRVGKTIHKVISKKAFPIIIGGDHSISYAIIKALSNEHKQLGIIHIDAHTDLADVIPGLANNHGNVFSYILKEKLTKHLYQFGIRGMIGKKLEAQNYSLYSLPFLRENDNLKIAVNQLDLNLKYYLSLDIDVLDPSIAPGTGTCVPFGMTTEMLMSLLSLIAAKVSILGFDLVEVNPMLDKNNRTAELANMLIIHLLAEIEKRTKAGIKK